MRDSNIIVAVRSRPLNESEREKNPNHILRIADEHVITFDPKDVNQVSRKGVPDHSTRAKDCSFAFDHVFDENSDNQTIFNHTASLLIDQVLLGFNCTCFAYVFFFNIFASLINNLAMVLLDLVKLIQ